MSGRPSRPKVVARKCRLRGSGRGRVLLAVTVDVEPDCSPSWDYASPLGFRGVLEGVREVLHPLLLEHGAVPTYLLNSVVLEDGPSVECLAGLPGGCELGVHPHPEFLEPRKRHADYAGKRGREDLCFLPADVEAGKIETITRLFERRLGRRPRSFRAGRFSAGANTIAALSRLGYLADTSVTPHTRWSGPGREPPVDFTAAPEQPYRVSAKGITAPDPEGGLIEVPVTIRRRTVLSLKRGVVWLRPGYSSLDDMRRLVDRAVDDAGSGTPPTVPGASCAPGTAGRGTVPAVLNMMFHNVEALPGLSPVSAAGEGCRAFLESLAGILSHLRSLDVEPATLERVAREFGGGGA